MDKGLDYYKQFIDAMVTLRHSVMVEAWVKKGKGAPQVPLYENINKFLSSLSAEQKEVVAELIQMSRDDGIHDILAYMDEQRDLDGLVLSKNGAQLPLSPFESMHYDFIARLNGDVWPDER